MSKKGLGKGLQALLPSTEYKTETGDSVIEIELKKIRVNKNQPRHNFDEEKLNELSISIREHGVIQPILVKAVGEGFYELVAGERRYRACQKIGLKKIPAIIKVLSEKETSEIALIENIQREDLNPIEEAVAYRTLMEDFALTQEELSQRVGKSRSFIANTVRLLALPEKVREMVLQGKLSAGHARTILTLTKIKDQEELAKRISIKGMSVRQTESTVKEMLKEKSSKIRSERIDPQIQDLEEKLRKKFSTKVIIKHGKKSGRIELEYYGDEELQRLLETLLNEEM